MLIQLVLCDARVEMESTRGAVSSEKKNSIIILNTDRTFPFRENFKNDNIDRWTCTQNIFQAIFKLSKIPMYY